MESSAPDTVARVVTGLVVIVLLVAGPLGGIDLVDSRAELGNGTASVTVREPTADRIRVTDGRFGASTSYVRLPDLVVDVDRVEGRPRVQYTIAVPELGIERTVTRVVTATGRLRLSVEDVGLPEAPRRSQYRGFLRVRIQSFTSEKTVVNRSVEVTIE